MSNYILTTNGSFVSEDELYHYGVLGMKWGIHRANRKTSANMRYQKKALKFDARSARLTKKAEKQHAKNDLSSSNKAAIKAANYLKKAAIVRKKALKTDDYNQLRAERKATKIEFKASKKQAAANRLSKAAGYGFKAMKYSIKSDKVKIKAAKMRSKIASNKAYIAMIDKRMNSLDSEKLRKVQESFSDYIREIINKKS